MRLDALGVYLEWASPFLVTEDKERWGGICVLIKTFHQNKAPEDERMRMEF